MRLLKWLYPYLSRCHEIISIVRIPYFRIILQIIQPNQLYFDMFHLLSIILLKHTLKIQKAILYRQNNPNLVSCIFNCNLTLYLNCILTFNRRQNDVTFFFMSHNNIERSSYLRIILKVIQSNELWIDVFQLLSFMFLKYILNLWKVILYWQNNAKSNFLHAQTFLNYILCEC